ncbi:hypothetical protein [Halorubrum sodomense]|uniref:Uncharacterized protein n=1 Tax=Halorubrum sodomense TaxID=35743 RepID=A0A1I6G9J6_HALSD|nr:hypothetical protein [Halorubrum sodomense]SFR38863.1 hypothetical protein SAMN04487937_1770 [Halorubrum sodomense]
MRLRDADAADGRFRFRGRPLVSWLLIAALVQLSVRALVGGAALIAAPSGRIVGLSTDALARTPFDDYLVPGVVLFVVFGLVSAAVCYGVYAGRKGAPAAAAAVGLALLGWLAVEALAGFDRPTIWLNLATAVAALALASRPCVRDGGRGADA